MWNLSIILYDCWEQVGVACLWFSKQRPPFCDRGGIFNSFFHYYFFSFFYCVIFLCFSAGLGSGLESKADIRTFTVNCLLDKPACWKGLDVLKICVTIKRLSHIRNLQSYIWLIFTIQKSDFVLFKIWDILCCLFFI